MRSSYFLRLISRFFSSFPLSSNVLPFFLLIQISTLPSGALSMRNKEIDENYQRLIPISQIPIGCRHARELKTENGGGEPAKEYGFVEGVGLEKCRVWLDEEQQSISSDEDGHYERYKCKHLRVHGHFNEETGKCECREQWKGPICNEFIGCPANHSYFMNVCTPNVCQHDGQLAIGSKHIECICKAPWDGRFCERLACWRVADKEHERRWRNAGDHCECADNYEGDQCERIVSCQNGELVGGSCQCAEGWKGEVCDRKCIIGQTCGVASASASLTPLGLMLSIVCTVFWLNQMKWIRDLIVIIF